MIESVEFSGTADNPVKVNLVRPNPLGFTILDIQNTGAGKTDLHTSSRASMDGDVFNGARQGGRSLVFEFGFGHMLDPEDGRETSYELFPLGESVRMEFVTDKKTVIIDGYVESNESTIFTREPGFKVVVFCVDPFFRSKEDEQTLFKLYSLEDRFEFPFENDSLTENQIIMGEYDVAGFGRVRYDGTVPTGLLIRLICIGPVTNPGVTNDKTQFAMKLESAKIDTTTGRGLDAGDIVEISTVRGSKSITLLRNGERTNILSALKKGSKWIELRKGLNPLSVNADLGFDQMQVEVLYDNYYSGL